MCFECGAWLLYQTTKPDMHRESDAMTYSCIGTVYIDVTFNKRHVDLT
jgi:hypothetical protein